MPRHPTVLLRHDTPAGLHYDWLMTDPNDVAGKLWTARVDVPSFQWQELACFDAEPTFAHRRKYLTFQGELSGNRGRVRRIDQGFADPQLWTASRIVVHINMNHFAGTIQLCKQSDVLWRATRLAV
jgi:hypothetical protein